MYKCSLADSELDKTEEIQATIARLQRTLGGVFNGVWHAWAKRATQGEGGQGGYKSTPRLNADETCKIFMGAWRRAGTPSAANT
eukprot:157466-Pyramimonas_sp.AAC.1